MLLYPVNDIKTTKLSATEAVVAASPEVAAMQRTGRHGIAITAGESAVYIGGKGVTAATGMAVPAGTTTILPVATTNTDNLYVIGGDCVLTEFF